MLDAAPSLTLPPRPVPNLGYACLNMALREQKPPIFTNRDCIKKSFTDKGLPFISGLALENSHNLAGVIQWNHENGVRFFRCVAIFVWDRLLTAIGVTQASCPVEDGAQGPWHVVVNTSTCAMGCTLLFCWLGG